MDSGYFVDIVNRMIYLSEPSYDGGDYKTFANLRFDVRTDEPIQFHSDYLGFNQSIYDHFPNPSLGFNDNRESDVLSVLQKFLDNDQAPLCGSIVYVLVCRYPDEADVSQMISRLRENHVFVHFIVKSTPSAGTNSKALFDVASATNGFCTFGDGDDFFLAGLYCLEVILRPYQFLSQNYAVSGSGRTEASFSTSRESSTEGVVFVVTLQDHPLDNNACLNYKITSVNGASISTGPKNQPYYGQYGNAIIDYFLLNGTSDYKLTMDYSYPGNKPQRIEARMYSFYYHDFLPLPPI